MSAGLDPLYRRACIWTASELELHPAQQGLAGQCEQKQMALKPADFILLYFLLGLHDFNGQEVKRQFKQNQNLVRDFRIQSEKDF